MMKFIRNHVVAKSALDALNPLVVFTNFAGISPYRVILTDKGNMKNVIYNPYVIYHVILMRLCYVVCIVFSISSGDTVVELFNDVPFIRFSEHLRIYIEALFMLCLFLTIYKQKDNYRRQVEALSDIDKDLGLIGVTKNYTDLKIFHIFVGCLYQIIHSVHFSLSVFYFAHWGKKPYSSYALVVTTGLPTYFATVILMIFVRIVAMATQNLKEINKELTKMVQKMQEITPKLKYEAKTNQFNLNLKNKLMTKRLTSIIKTYCKVCDLSKEMSDDFGAQILIIVSMAFIFMVVNTFLFLNILATMISKEEFTHRKIFFLTYCIHTFVIHAINMFTLTKACDNCENEASECAALISKLTLDETDEKIQTKINQFYLILLHRKPTYTACGYIHVNNKLIFTMTGAATTYLIILAQFYLSNVGTVMNGSRQYTNITNNDSI